MQSYLMESNITVLPWPGPDLNPVENCWCELGEKLAEMKSQSKRRLQELLINVWCYHLSGAYIQYLIQSLLEIMCIFFICITNKPIRYIILLIYFNSLYIVLSNNLFIHYHISILCIQLRCNK